MNTDFFVKGGTLGKHGNKAFNGLSAAAILFLYVNFVTKDDFVRECDACAKRIEKCDEKRSRIWQRLMDHEVALVRVGLITTNR